MSIDNPRPALAGVRVIDLTQFESGTVCTETLAWLGADVIKVEEPSQGDAGRRSSTDTPGLDSHYFLLLNANKRSVTLNLKDERGRDMLRDMLRDADVFVENFGPGVIERLGFGYEQVRAINRRIVYAQVKGYGEGSPYAAFPAFDMIAQAVGGSLATTGEKGGRPIRPGPTMADTGSGLHLVIGILAALNQRHATGEGQRIEVAMQDVVINFSRIAYASHALWGKPPGRNGNQSLLSATSPSEVYPCKGGGENDYCFVYTTRAGNRQWENLLKAIGREDLIGDARFSSPQQRYAHRDQVDEMISAWTRTRHKREAMETLGRAGVPAGAILDTQELRDDEYLRRRGTFVTVNHPTRGDFTMPGWPVKMSASHVPVTSAPLLGQHTDEVYGELLGATRDDLARLRGDGVI